MQTFKTFADFEAFLEKEKTDLHCPYIMGAWAVVSYCDDPMHEVHVCIEEPWTIPKPEPRPPEPPREPKTKAQRDAELHARFPLNM